MTFVHKANPARGAVWARLFAERMPDSRSAYGPLSAIWRKCAPSPPEVPSRMWWEIGAA